MNLDLYLDNLLRKEGGYVDHPADRGGPTKYGITEPVARAFGYQDPLEELPMIEAKRIYRDRYWLQPKLDEVEKISETIAEELFDTGVNMGPATAVRFLQRALNVLNAQEKIHPDIAVDGQIGRMTLAALEAFIKTRGREGQLVLWRMLNSQQAVRYIEIAERNRSQESFQFGWQLHRVEL